MKNQAYGVTFDEEEGTWTRTFLGYVTGAIEEECDSQARDRWPDKTACLFPAGMRVKLHGSISRQARTRLLQEAFNARSREEEGITHGGPVRPGGGG